MNDISKKYLNEEPGISTINVKLIQQGSQNKKGLIMLRDTTPRSLAEHYQVITFDTAGHSAGPERASVSSSQPPT